MYIDRHIEHVLKKAEHQTKVVLLTGSRQVGKTTAIVNVFPDYTYITLDDENELMLALKDRSLFFRDRRFPVIIDEVQYAKELLREIKKVADQEGKKGQIFITGSQTYDLLSLSAETLAGRISIISMSGLSCREMNKVSFNSPFLPTKEYMAEREKLLCPYDGIWERICRGSFPELIDADRDWEWFYRDYIRTYIERDIRRIVNVKDELKFRSFLISLAARSAQLIVYEDIARDVGIDSKTAMHWTSVVAASGLVAIIQPYFNNAIKRAIKTPKLYFMDTGLLCYLVGWKTPQTAKNGAMAGSIFETFVISEIIKSYQNAGKDISGIYFYRDKDKKEIDLIIENDGVLYPIEIKKGATVQKDWTKNFSVLKNIADKSIGEGTVLCRIDHRMAIEDGVTALPISYI